MFDSGKIITDISSSCRKVIAGLDAGWQAAQQVLKKRAGSE